jgi:SAM-dependent methyltransferase
VSGWDDEYGRGGVPSSIRDAPSGAVVWALENWPRLAGEQTPRRALDVGCGTARNSLHLARHGTRVTGFDASAVAVERGRERVRDAGAQASVELLVHDLQAGLPVAAGEVDLVLDVFVYKHQVQPAARARYRQELRRVLAPGGRVLLSLAEPDDGYYGACPPSPEPGAGPHAIVDPQVGAGSVLFSLAELEAELADGFALEMAWRKDKPGTMHGREYRRRTLATLWRPA